MKLTVQEVCNATGGTLVCGCPEAFFTSVTIDSRTVQPGALFVPLPGSRVDGHAYIETAIRQGASGFLVKKHHPLVRAHDAAGIAVHDTLAALQDLSAWYRNRLKAQVIGIAGSNGKTTTKELLAQVCAVAKNTLATQGNQNNHIGLPLTLLRAEEDAEILVLELGTSGPGELTALCRLARPHIGVITTIAEEHTETLKDLAGVIAAETELIAALPPDGVAVVNGDDAALLAAVQQRACCRIVTFGEGPRNQFRVGAIQVTRQGTRCTLYTPAGVRSIQLTLLGSHFALAALVSVAVAVECGLAIDAACAALRVARGAPRRMAVLEVPERQLTVLDDCYNANPASMRQALLTAQQVRATGERLVLVLGDMLELGTLSDSRHRAIGEVVAALTPRPDLLVTVGEDARLIAAVAEHSGITVQTFPAVESAADFIQQAVGGFDGPQLVLVKGSRGVHLEEVTRRITERQMGKRGLAV